MRVGFTVTKKIGGAVVRNRMKRRFRALAREIVPGQGLRRRRPCDDRPRQAASSAISACCARSLPARSTGCAAMIAQAADPDRARLAEGPVAGASAELPLPAELLGLCDHRNSTLWRRARGLDGPEAHPAAATPGAARATTRYRDEDHSSERQQEFDPRGGAERARAARLDAGPPNKYFPTANPPSTKVENGKQQPLPQPQAQPSAPATPKALQTASAVAWLDARASRIHTPSLQGSINLKGAQIDDLLLLNQRQTIAKNSPPVRLLSPLGAPGAYIAAFGWTGQGAQAPALDTLWTADSQRLTPGQPVTLTTQTRRRHALPDQDRGRRRLSVHRPAERHQRVGQAARRSARSASSAAPTKSPTLDSWTNHVGPIGVFDGKANYDVNWKDLDQGKSRDVRQRRQRLARLHRQILADRAGRRRAR